MRGCRKVQGLIAESLYEELEESNRQILEGHLAQCPRCKDEAATLGLLISSIPSTRAELEGDLVPILRGRLHERTPLPVRGRFRLAFAGAVACVLGVLAIGYIVLDPGHSGQGPDQIARNEEAVLAATPLQAHIAEGDRLIAQGEYSTAYMVLAKALEENPLDSAAGELQLKMADLAYNELRWYPQAFEAYEGLRVRYTNVFRSDPICVERLNVLDEARGPAGDYASLHALNAAELQGDFEGLEEVISQFPATYVASMAAGEMTRMVASEAGNAPGLEAMQTALARCTHPLAVAQLKVEVGHLLLEDSATREAAKTLYREVAASENKLLARLAQESLAGLDGP